MPKQLLTEFAIQHNATNLMTLALRTGLLAETRIRVADGTDRTFLISPHFYIDLAAEYGEDACDRVKIFLDSIRNGQHFGQLETRKIFNPERLLEVLLNRGWVGPASAIGSGYLLPEKAGIVRVEHEHSWRYKMHLVQEDGGNLLFQVISAKYERCSTIITA